MNGSIRPSIASSRSISPTSSSSHLHAARIRKAARGSGAVVTAMNWSCRAMRSQVARFAFVWAIV